MPRAESVLDASKAPGTGEILQWLRRTRPRRSAQAGDGKEAASGCKGLTSGDRSAVTTIEKTRAHTAQAVSEADSKERDFEAPDGDIPTTTIAAQLGRPLHHSDIIKRLLSLNPNFIFERSKAFPDIMGIYFPDREATEGRKHVMGFEYDYSPEFTVRHPNGTGPKKLTRGWRAIIIMLSRRGYIEFERACSVFKISRGRSSKHWQTDVRAFARK